MTPSTWPQSKPAEARRAHRLGGAGAWLASAALVALVFALWWPALGASFQFDDFNVIVADARVHSLPAWLASMPGIRPLLKLSYALNFSIDPGPRGFRLLNVAIHAANSCLVAALLWRLECGGGLARAPAASATVVATLVFALHPVQTESVTYVSGRSVSLAALPCLLALLCWVRGRDAASPRAAGAWRGLALLAFVLALGVRETSIVLPLALLLWSAAQPHGAGVQRDAATARRLAPAWRGLLPPFALAALALAVAVLWPPYRHLLDTSLGIRSVGVNLMTQAHALGYLAAQLVRPWGMNADPALPVTTQLDALTILLGLVWITVVASGLLLLRRRPAIALGLLWFPLWLLPTNSLLPRYDVANDRQLYLALIGPAWLLGHGVATACRHLAPRPAVARAAGMTVACMLGAVLAIATLQHNRVYADEIRYWLDVAGKSPLSPRAANNLGIAYALACRDTDAAREFARALQLQPGYIRARINQRLLREGALFPDPASGAAVRADLGTRRCTRPQ